MRDLPIFSNRFALGRRINAAWFWLKDYCEDHDINYAAVQKIVKSQPERNALLEQVSRLFDIGINSTPTYIINGVVMGFGPEGQFTIDAIKKALGVK